MEKVSGIYSIINKTNGKYYIGSSSDIHTRWKQHKYFLNKHHHQNIYLQRSWNKYGQPSFDFTILKPNVPYDKLLIEEQEYLNNTNKKQCYNLSLIAGRVEMTEETRNKISRSLTGRKMPYRPCNPEHVKKRVESRKWYKHHSQKTREKISLARIGSHVSEETKKKISEACKGMTPHNVDNTIITFSNKITNETFTGKKSDFIKKYSLFKQPVYDVINGSRRRKSYKGWTVNH